MSSETSGRVPNSNDRIGYAIIVLATLMLINAVLSSGSLQSANDRSRWCTVWSLVERGTFQIDEIDANPKWSTIDKVRHRQSETEPYHFYSSKPPLLSTIVAALYWVEKNLIGYNLIDHTDVVCRTLLLLVNVLPMFLALLSLRKSLRLIGMTGFPLWILLAAAGFGSMLNPFLTTLNNHTPAAIAVIFCLSAMVRVIQSPIPSRFDFAIIGFTAALTCCFELPAALFGVLAFLFVLKFDWRKAAVWFVPAALVPLVAFFVTNIICTGGIKPFYAYYGTDKYVYVHEGVPSYWTNPQGIDANTESPVVYAMHCLIGHHGIFSLSPIFLLTVPGWLLAAGGTSQWRIIKWMGIGLTFIVLGFYLTRTANYNYGGNSAALRWMLWLIPFWWYGMIPAVQRLAKSRSGISVTLVLLLASVGSSFSSLSQPWRPNWLFAYMENAGWIDYRTKILPFSPTRYSLISRLPDSQGSTSEWVQSIGRQRKLRLETRLPVLIDGSEAFIVNLQVTSAGDPSQAVDLVMLPDGFQRGEDVSVWLKVVSADNLAIAVADSNDQGKPLVVDGSMLSDCPKWALDILRGLPTSRAFNSASPRYLKYTRWDGEKTALKCERGASRVQFVDPEFGKCWQRCDVYYCDQLPFGVAQWKITVTSDATKEVIREELWTCQQFP